MEQELRRISATTDPMALTLEQGFNHYVRRTVIADGTETGIIQCGDGGASRYWFCAHNGPDNEGNALFRFSDGREFFVTGRFCCEVQLPERQLASLEEMRRFIQGGNGKAR